MVRKIAEDKKSKLSTDIEDEQTKENGNKLMTMIKKIDNPWGLTPKALTAKKAALAMIATKNGMYARVPLVCKAEGCPYSDSCMLLAYDMAPEGEYCPTEIAQIEKRSAGYSQDIDYDSASFTDKNLLSELVTLDIMLERCKALISREGTPVIDIAIGIDNEGNEIRQPTVSKSWEAYEKISKKRDSVYQLLMLTRKDKKSDDSDDSISTSQMLRDVISSGVYKEE